MYQSYVQTGSNKDTFVPPRLHPILNDVSSFELPRSPQYDLELHCDPLGPFCQINAKKRSS